MAAADDRKPLHDTLLGQMAYCTLRIETAEASGISTGCGTGFVFQLEFGGYKLPLILTNRHVVEGAPSIRIQLHEQGPEKSLRPGPGRTVTVAGGPPAVFYHPDPEIDLAAIQLLHVTEVAKAEGWTPFYRHLPREALADTAFIADLDAVEEVYMVGYPNGLYDSHNNLPVVRKGITATPAAVLYEGRPEFLVDMAVYTGSSGSPIFVNRVTQFLNSQGELQDSARLRLLGVLHSGHMITEHGEVISGEIGQTSTVRFHQMINLGICLNAQILLGFEDVVRSAKISQASWEVNP